MDLCTCASSSLQLSSWESQFMLINLKRNCRICLLHRDDVLRKLILYISCLAHSCLFKIGQKPDHEHVCSFCLPEKFLFNWLILKWQRNIQIRIHSPQLALNKARSRNDMGLLRWERYHYAHLLEKNLVKLEDHILFTKLKSRPRENIPPFTILERKNI